MNTQTEALRLAEMFDSLKLTVVGAQNALPMEEAATELRRLHEVNQELVEALKEVIRVIESNPPSITDTVWVTNGSPETLYDHCQAALAKARGTE